MNTTTNEKGFKTYKVKTIEDVKKGILDYFPFLNEKQCAGYSSHIYSVVSSGRLCLFTYDDTKPDYYYINHICTTIKFEPILKPLNKQSYENTTN